MPKFVSRCEKTLAWLFNQARVVTPWRSGSLTPRSHQVHTEWNREMPVFRVLDLPDLLFYMTEKGSRADTEEGLKAQEACSTVVPSRNFAEQVVSR